MLDRARAGRPIQGPSYALRYERMSNHRTLLCLAICALAAPVVAQNPSPAPKFLYIADENVKPGKHAAHEKNESAWVTAYSTAKLPNYYVAVTPMTGGTNVLYLSGFASWTEMQANNDSIGKVPGLNARIAALAEKDGDYLNGVRIMIAQQRGDLMEGPDVDYSKVRGWRISTYRLRIGQNDEFLEARRMLKDAYTRAGVTRRVGVYQITQGVNVPTFLVFRPFESLAEFDADSAMAAKVRAVRTAAEIAKSDSLNTGAIVTAETNTYMVSPAQSFVPATYAYDPFWKTNPVIAAAAAKANVTQAGAARKGTKKQ
jgi:hypothetical protein